MSFKLSDYLIFTDKINSSNDRIAYSLRENKPLLISEKVYNCLTNNSFSEIPKPVISSLLKNKIIIENIENELDIIINENIEVSSRVPKTQYFIIQPTGNCQLSCSYCGQSHNNLTVSEDTIELIVERIKNKVKECNSDELQIGWFGGEPLLAYNQIKSITNSLTSFCKDNNVRYAAKIVTNGVNLNLKKYIELTQSLSVKQVEITLDGDKDYHDKFRKTHNNKGSFDAIIKNLQEIDNWNKKNNIPGRISIRCNVNKYNVEGISPLIVKLKELNLENLVRLYTKGIYSWAKNNADKDSLTARELAKYELKWLKLMIKLSFPINIEVPKRKYITCLTTSINSELYDGYGNIYSCSEVSYSDIYKNGLFHIGNLNKSSLIDEKNRLSNWSENIHASKNHKCHKCEYLPVCAGACPKAWLEGKYPCPTYRYNLKERLHLRYNQFN